MFGAQSLDYLASDTPSGCSPEYRAQRDIPAALRFQRRQRLAERREGLILQKPTIWGHRVENREVRLNDSQVGRSRLSIATVGRKGAGSSTEPA